MSSTLLKRAAPKSALFRVDQLLLLLRSQQILMPKDKQNDDPGGKGGVRRVRCSDCQMMDPISVIGLAAGVAQIVDVGGRGLLGLIELLRRLRETPKRMIELLQDVDKSIQRIYTLRSSMQQPTPFFVDLSKEQVQRMTCIVDNAYQATIHLKNTLEPVFGRTTVSKKCWAERAWKSVISARMERSVTEKINRIERLNIEIIGEMQLVNLEMGVTIKGLSTQTQESVHQTASQLRSLRMSNLKIQQATQDACSKLLQLSSNTLITEGFDQAVLMDVIPNLEQFKTNTQLHHKSLGIAGIDIPRNSHQRCDNIKTKPRHENLQTRVEISSEIASPADILLKALEGNGSTIAATFLSDNPRNTILANKVGKQLLKAPGSLKDVCEMIDLARWSVSRGSMGRRKSIRCTCNQIDLQKRSYWRKGPFSIEYSYRAAHITKCPFYWLHQRSWSYSFSAQLLPFIQRAIQITFDMTIGAGGGSIGPSLRYFGVIERSKSPAFKLFDDFPDRCAHRINLRPCGVEDAFVKSTEGQFVVRSMNEDRNFYFAWDLELVRTEIAKLRRDLSVLLSSGCTSAVYSDEFGNTLLHAVFVLIGLLGSHSNQIWDELRDLAWIIIDNGVPVYAASQQLAFDYISECQLCGAIRGASTALDMASNLAMETLKPSEYCSFYEIIGDFIDEESLKIPYLPERHIARRAAALLCMRHDPGLLDCYVYGPIEKAIVYRSLDRTKDALQRTQFQAQSHDGKLSPLELAIGWPSGLQLLLAFGVDVLGAIRLAIHLDDLRSTKILLASSCFPGGSEDGWSQVLRDLTSSSSRNIRQFAVQTLRVHRQTLSELAMKELSRDESSKLGLLNEKTLDVAAFRVYQKLQEMRVDMPLNSNPASRSSLHGGHLTVYHSILLDGQCPSLELLDCLFDSGFECVDAFDGEGRTALFSACNKFANGRLKEVTMLAINWFLDKGACPNFLRVESYPNALFYMALNFTRNVRGESKDIDSIFEHLIQQSASICSPLDRDNCKCHCSSSGCLPLHKFWKCDTIHFYHPMCSVITIGTLLDALETWLDLCGLDETQSELYHEEICRLEVFDRLGMAHTCCAYKGLKAWSSSPEEDQTELQEEDEELKDQLDLIMIAYQEGRVKHLGGFEDFWKLWMQELNEILPSLEPEERCIYRCLSNQDYHRYRDSTDYSEKENELHNHRMQVEEKALTRKGYSGLEFIDVIQLHFADYLKPS